MRGKHCAVTALAVAFFLSCVERSDERDTATGKTSLNDDDVCLRLWK